jgi:hypothetical protein
MWKSEERARVTSTHASCDWSRPTSSPHCSIPHVDFDPALERNPQHVFHHALTTLSTRPTYGFRVHITAQLWCKTCMGSLGRSKRRPRRRSIHTSQAALRLYRAYHPLCTQRTSLRCWKQRPIHFRGTPTSTTYTHGMGATTRLFAIKGIPRAAGCGYGRRQPSQTTSKYGRGH